MSIDDPHLLAGLARALQAHGVQPLLPGSAPGAAAPPDVPLLIDRSADGARAAQAAAGEPPLRFWLVEPGDRDVGAHAAAAGVVAWFRKPVEPEHVAYAIGRALALQAELRRLQAHERALRRSLQVARRVGAAVGMLAEQHRIAIEPAFDLLRREARSRRQPLPEAAEAVVTRYG